jgi:hypothetical protein
MRQATTRILGCLTFLLVLCGTSGWAAAVAVNTCGVAPDPAGTFRVDTLLEASSVALNGYINATCNLEILTTLPSGAGVMAPNLTITAKSIKIAGPDVVPPGAPKVEIINTAANSTIRFTARAGDITLLNADVRARKTLNFQCVSPTAGPPCKFESDGSEIVAATNLQDGPGGVLIIDTDGDVDIQTTRVHGGDEWKITAGGSITVGPCGSGGGPEPCRDPTVSPFTPTVLALCGNPPVFPCPALGTLNQAGVKSICIPDIVVVVPCNGGFKEKRFEAGTFINVEGTTITSHEHITFVCGPEGFRGAGSNLSSSLDQVIIDCQGPVDITTAHLSGFGGVFVRSDCAGVAAGVPCINATGATLDDSKTILMNGSGPGLVRVCGGLYAASGPSFPTLNGSTGGPGTPYGNNVQDTAAECGAAGAGTFCRNDTDCFAN